MGLNFSGVSSARPTGTYRYIEPGHYYMILTKAKEVVSPKDQSDGVAFEHRVLKVIGDEEGKALPAGTDCSYLLKQGQYFNGDIKRMFMGIMGWNNEQASDPNTGLNEQFFKGPEGIFSPANPLAGVVVEIKAWTKGDGPFVAVEYVRSVPAAEWEALGIAEAANAPIAS